MKKAASKLLPFSFWLGLFVSVSCLLWLVIYFTNQPNEAIALMFSVLGCLVLQVAAYIGGTRFKTSRFWPAICQLASAPAVLWCAWAGPGSIYALGPALQHPESLLTPSLLWLALPILLGGVLAGLGWAVVGVLALADDIVAATARRPVKRPAASAQQLRPSPDVAATPAFEPGAPQTGNAALQGDTIVAAAAQAATPEAAAMPEDVALPEDAALHEDAALPADAALPEGAATPADATTPEDAALHVDAALPDDKSKNETESAAGVLIDTEAEAPGAATQAPGAQTATLKAAAPEAEPIAAAHEVAAPQKESTQQKPPGAGGAPRRPNKRPRRRKAAQQQQPAGGTPPAASPSPAPASAALAAAATPKATTAVPPAPSVSTSQAAGSDEAFPPPPGIVQANRE